MTDQEKIERLVECVKFYADEESWHNGIAYSQREVVDNSDLRTSRGSTLVGGKRAKAALHELERATRLDEATPAENDAKLRDDVGPLYFVPWVSPRISREIAVRLNADLQHIRAQESAKMKPLVNAARATKVLLEKMKAAGYGSGAPDSLVDALRPFEKDAK